MESAQKMAQVDSDLMGFQWDSNITYHHPDGPSGGLFFHHISFFVDGESQKMSIMTTFHLIRRV